MSAQSRIPQRGNAYQPRVKPWVEVPHESRVLKERRISSDGRYAPEQPRCGVPSERMNCIPTIPGVSPRAGMRYSVGAWKFPSAPRALPWAGMQYAVGA